ncbi:ankyrin repeat-containing domain protein [Whalleya microplaca]|nr:ankyrin repeat-containing domain protein [Whalleya microplaca]
MATLSQQQITDLLDYAQTDDISSFDSLVTEITEANSITKGKVISIPRRDDAKTILHVAAINKSSQVLGYCVVPDRWAQQEELLEEFVDRQDNEGRTALHYACAAGDVSPTRYLLHRMASVGIQDNDQNSALHHAVLGGTVRLVKALIDTYKHEGLGEDVKINLNATNNDGQSALHLAAGRNDKPMAEALVNKGISARIVDRNGNTAYAEANRKGYTAVTVFLASRGITA